jgi:GH15 family glucan-1,4-alpha-glucosidase
MSYQPIENYGIVGNLHTIALIGLNGSIDFMCFPRFDSPSVFARLLDDKKGGFFCITPEFREMKQKQLYLPDTNVLLTRFLSPDGVGETTDFMPVGTGVDRKLIRRITTIRGEVKYRLQCSPRFNYGNTQHKTMQKTPDEIIFHSDGPNGLNVRLSATIPLKGSNQDAMGEFTLPAGESADIILEIADSEIIPAEKRKETVTTLMVRTINYWKDWIDHSTYQGRWRETVNRSALVLKLLTSDQYGSIIAAPTFGLPETVGGKRNWDYRYTWIRDASFTVYTFLRLGYTKEAEAFMNWMKKICHEIGGKERLGIMYSIDGNRQLAEHELENFEGYKCSSPSGSATTPMHSCNWTSMVN